MIITGSQRSGTMSIADIFGIAHEVQFNTYTTLTTLYERQDRIRSEASWLAQPFIEQLLEWKIKIIHLVRHPIKVINSLEGIQFWNDCVAGHKPYRDFAYMYTGISREEESSVVKSMQYWIIWNKKISEKHIPRIRLEDIMNKPQLNSRRRGEIYDWKDLPQDDAVLECKELAKEYGYI